MPSINRVTEFQPLFVRKTGLDVVTSVVALKHRDLIRSAKSKLIQNHGT